VCLGRSCCSSYLTLHGEVHTDRCFLVARSRCFANGGPHWRFRCLLILACIETVRAFFIPAALLHPFLCFFFHHVVALFGAAFRRIILLIVLGIAAVCTTSVYSIGTAPFLGAAVLCCCACCASRLFAPHFRLHIFSNSCVSLAFFHFHPPVFILPFCLVSRAFLRRLDTTRYDFVLFLASGHWRGAGDTPQSAILSFYSFHFRLSPVFTR
jgi:hypothetical protein